MEIKSVGFTFVMNYGQNLTLPFGDFWKSEREGGRALRQKIAGINGSNCQHSEKFLLLPYGNIFSPHSKNISAAVKKWLSGAEKRVQKRDRKRSEIVSC